MKIIKDRQIIENQWQLELDLATSDQNGFSPIRTEKNSIIPLRDWLNRRGQRTKEGNPGVLLLPEDEVSKIEEYLEEIPLIALNFSDFHEGRGYSQATKLRQQHRYGGEIRAINAHLDNLSMMERCGINAFDLADTENIEEAMSYFREITELPYS